MAVAQQIAEYLRRIEQLKMERDGIGAFEQVSVQAEIFRLSGILQGILTFQRDPIWTELEPLGIVKHVLKEELEETWKQLKETKIPKGTLGTETNSQVVAEFPRYLELPGPVVRELILSYLTDPNDELSVAKAIPSEVQYLSGPLNLIQLKAVFPILMEKKLLEPLDLMNLSAADPYIHGFIRKYFDSVLCKNTDYLTSEENWMALDHVPVTGNLAVVPLVVINKFNNATWDKLRTCGRKILHCCIQLLLEDEQEDEHQQLKLKWIKSYLQLLPNLRTLIIFERWAFFPEEYSDLVTPPADSDVFPELPFLKNLIFKLKIERFRFLSLTLLEVYGGQLEMFHMYPFVEPQFPISWPCLSSLSLAFHTGDNRFILMKTVINFISRIADCPLKVLNLDIHQAHDYPRKRFQQLLTLISNIWGERLECLQLNMGIFELEGFTWTGVTQNLGFPKLKQITLENCYSFGKSWDFLLCCPALEKLTFHSKYLPSWMTRNVVIDEQTELRSLIEVYNDREGMLRSNIWKLFPKLEQVCFWKWKEDSSGTYRAEEVGVTRMECLAYQLQ